jgi:hypothetical protein
MDIHNEKIRNSCKMSQLQVALEDRAQMAAESCDAHVLATADIRCSVFPSDAHYAHIVGLDCMMFLYFTGIKKKIKSL